MSALKFKSRLLPCGFTSLNALRSAAETGLHVKSNVLQSANIYRPSGKMREREERAEGRLTSHLLQFSQSKKEDFTQANKSKETVPEFFTLFSHSTRSTSGKCTYRGRKQRRSSICFITKNEWQFETL